MSSLKISILVIFVFALGFWSGEYSNAQKNVQLISGGVENNKNPEINIQQLKAVPAVNLSATTDSLVHATSSMAVSPVFSWRLVNQLITSKKYDQAIGLLQSQIGNPKNAAQAWYTLGLVYKSQGQPVAVLDAWFRALKLEINAQKTDRILKDIKNYLILLQNSPDVFNEDYAWLIKQFEELLTYNANDGDLHLRMASLYIKTNDDYQAQYHALMAVNDPQVQKSAEAILAKLNGEQQSEDIEIPLVISGNQYIVNATIEGYPVRLLLDTGASLSGLSNSYTEKYPSLLKDLKPIRLNTASGSKDSFLFTVNSINLGSLAFNQHILAQLPMDNAGAFDGLLGVDILGRFDFVIDQNTAVLKLKARKK